MKSSTQYHLKQYQHSSRIHESQSCRWVLSFKVAEHVGSPTSKFLKERQAGPGFATKRPSRGLTSHDKPGITKLPPINILMQLCVSYTNGRYTYYPPLSTCTPHVAPLGACTLGAGSGAAFAVGAAASASSSESASTTWMRLKSELETCEGHQQIHASIFWILNRSTIKLTVIFLDVYVYRTRYSDSLCTCVFYIFIKWS